MTARLKKSRPTKGPGRFTPAPLRATAEHHLAMLLASLKRLGERPLSAAMTVGVIALALAMPAALHLAVKNLQQVAGQYEDLRQLSVYLHPGTDAADAQATQAALVGRLDIAAVTLLDPDQSLAEFRAYSGFGEALDALGDNPLPWVAVVVPAPTVTGPGQLQQMAEEIEALPAVDFAQLDLEWLNRLNALLRAASRASIVLASLLAIAVLLIVGNTIRLELQTRGEEIEITRLLGATDGFVRRPFLYLGFWYGLAGGLVAVLIILLALALVTGPVQELALSYQSQYRLAGPSGAEWVVLVVAGAAIGWLGALLAVARQISGLEPD